MPILEEKNQNGTLCVILINYIQLYKYIHVLTPILNFVIMHS